MKPFIELTTSKLISILSPYKDKNVFIVHGKGSYNSCGAKKLFDDAFKQLNCKVLEHFDFTENPKWEEIKAEREVYNSFVPDLVIAVGGGSVIDTAKLIRFFSGTSETPESYNKETKPNVPLFAFPTTSGTGSEATHFAVCYVNGKKYSVDSKNILPDQVFVDYRFTLNNPKYLTACTGLDALGQAIESYWSVKSTFESRRYAIKAIKMIYPNLLSCVNNQDPKSRAKISEGSYYAGKAINISYTTAPHAFSYGITSKYGLPHGHAVALSLPYFFEYNSKVNESNCNDIRGAKFVQKRIHKLTKLLGIKESAKKELTAYINSILQKEDITDWFEQNKAELSKSVNLQRLTNNPVKVE